MAVTLGIDFGTTNTSAALALEDGEILDVRLGSPTNPWLLRTAVLLEDDKPVAVGEEALTSPRSSRMLVRSFKPLLHNAVQFRTFAERVPGPRYFVPDHVGEGMKRVGGDDRYYLRTEWEALPIPSGWKLAHLVIATEAIFSTVRRALDVQFGGLAIDRLVLSVPVGFSDVGKERVIRAAVGAGLVTDRTRISTMPEPLAIALAYGTELRAPRTVLVFDHGGGTLDLAVVHIDGDPNVRFRYQVLSQGRLDRAGSHYDLLLWDAICRNLRTSSGAELLKALRVERPEFVPDPTLLLEVERCKIDLCGDHRKAEFSFSVGAVDVGLPLEYGLFDGVLADELIHIKRLIEGAMDEARQNSLEMGVPFLDEVDEVLLAGGSSSIPSIQRLLQDMFPGKCNLDYVGSGTGTRGLALASRYERLIRNLVGTEYRLVDFTNSSTKLLLARHTPADMADWEYLGRSNRLLRLDAQQRDVTLLVVGQEAERPRPAFEAHVVVKPGRQFYVGLVVTSDDAHPCVRAAYCDNGENIPVVQIVAALDGQIPVLLEGHVVRWAGRIGGVAPGAGLVRRIRGGRKLTRQSMAVGDLAAYVLEIDELSAQATCRLVWPSNAQLKVLDVPLPGPGERVELKSHGDRFVQLREFNNPEFEIVGQGQ